MNGDSSDMDNKVLAGIVAIVVVVVIVAAAAIMMNNDGGDSDDPSSDTVIIYDGNGGTSNGSSTVESNSSTVQSMGFSNGNALFINWNTKADGTGTTYNEGSTVSASSGEPITLYAQWGYIPNIFLSNDASSVLTPMFITQTTQFVITGLMDVFPASGEAAIYIQPSIDMVWSYDESSNTFTAQNGNFEYIVTMNITSGVENLDIYINSAGYPVMSFDIVGQMVLSIDIDRQRVST